MLQEKQFLVDKKNTKFKINLMRLMICTFYATLSILNFPFSQSQKISTSIIIWNERHQQINELFLWIFQTVFVNIGNVYECWRIGFEKLISTFLIVMLSSLANDSIQQCFSFSFLFVYQSLRLKLILSNFTIFYQQKKKHQEKSTDQQTYNFIISKFFLFLF